MGVCFSNKKFILTDTINININTNRNQMNKSMSYQFDESKSGNIKPSAFIKKKHFSNISKEYIIQEFIGKGAFGTVRKVTHILTNQVRAMKTISRTINFAKDESSFMKEVEILKNLDHPNIIKIYDFYYDNNNYYIINEFIKGGELFEIINSIGVFTEAFAALIMKQILKAVNYFHSKGIVHRDLKPENILFEKNNYMDDNNKSKLSNDFTIKIIDFGASSILKNNNILTEKTGTPYYIAPEVLNKKYDKRCDIWSCGVIMFILLNGEPPFAGSDENEIISNVKKGYINWDCLSNKKLSKESIDLLKSMLNTNYQMRPSAELILMDPWFIKNAPNINVNQSSALKILDNLKAFQIKEKLIEASMNYLSNQFISKEEQSELTSIFQSLDLNNDGKLSYNEIVDGYNQIYGYNENKIGSIKTTKGESIANNIFKTFRKIKDSDYITYQEFLIGSADKKNIITEKKLEAAFKIFDKNGDGSISSNEIKSVLCNKNTNKGDYYWNSIIKEVDLNGDGEISFEEFKILMMKVLNEKEKNMNVRNDKMIMKKITEYSAENSVEVKDRKNSLVKKKYCKDNTGEVIDNDNLYDIENIRKQYI